MHSIDNVYNENRGNLTSVVIRNFRFPLMLCILFIHSFPQTVISGTPVYEQMCNIRWFVDNPFWISTIFLFFFFSGFLFFHHSNFNLSEYVGKLKRRFHSLVIPYLFWISVTIFIRYMVELLIPSMSSTRHLPVSQYSLSDFVLAFWNIDGSGPIYTPFWFLRDLIVMCIFALVIFGLIKKFKFIGLSLIIVCELFIGSGCIYGISVISFSTGAYFGIFDINFIDKLKPFYKPSLLLVLPLLCLGYIYKYHVNWVYYALVYLSALCLIILVITLMSGITEKGFVVNKSLTNSSFFLFAYHGLPSIFLAKMCVRYLSCYGIVPIALCFFVIPLLVAFIGVILYVLIRHFLPRFSSFITGGR
jgi:hypothetical protein